jgi:uncharacterized protein
VKEHAIDVGVSYDFVPGVRRNLAGRETETAVLRNMDRLERAGVPFGVIVVLAKHTARQITAIYDFFASRAVPLRVLPLFDGPSARPEALFALPYDEIIDAMQRLFVHWVDTGRAVRVSPLDEYLCVAVRALREVREPMWSRRTHGEAVLIANTDGRLFGGNDDYSPESLLGDLRTQTLEEIYASERYARSMAHDEAITARVCAGCAFEGACNGTPIFTEKHAALHEGRCAIESRMFARVAEYIRALGFTKEELTELVANRPAA